jgi:hypothetical protein
LQYTKINITLHSPEQCIFKLKISNLCYFVWKHSFHSTEIENEKKKAREMERVIILREGKELIRTFNGHY